MLDKLLGDQPLSLAALERVVTLTQASGEPARAQGALQRARDEARKQAATLADIDTVLTVTPFSALQQVFDWQKQHDSRSFAGQAAAAGQGWHDHAKNLTADAAADDAGDGIAERSEVLVLHDGARDVAADSA